MDKFDKCFKYYEKAIEGRNFHYQNYNTWVNYYSIFNGALFVGYYSLLQEKSSFLLFFITLLGFISAFCWHSTVKGHYIWMISWIKVVHDYEEELNKISTNDEKYYVYSVYTRPKKDFYMKNISTQKMTSVFTFIVCIAWGLLLIYVTYNILDKVFFFNNLTAIKIVLSIIFVIILFFIFKAGLCKKSDISFMKSSIKS